MLSDMMIEFLTVIRKQGFITRKTQKVFGMAGFYLATSVLRDKGIIQFDGVTQGNTKKWVLTQKGERISELYLKRIEIEKKIKEEESKKEELKE